MAATAAGDWVGAHVLAVLTVMLLATLVATVGLARWLRVGAVEAAGPSRQHRIRRRVAVALCLIAAGAGVFAVLATQLEPGSAVTRFDLAVSTRVGESTPRAVVACFAALTHAGDGETRTVSALVVGAALLLRRRPLLAFGFAGALAGGGALNTVLKHWVGRARPLQPPGGEVVHGYSFPSGHSAGSMVAFGMLAYLALRLLPPRWHLPALCLAVAGTVSVGASRVIVRAHFPSDVLAGFAWGAAWLMLCVLVLEGLSARSRPAS